jgi:ABC-2 type transport system permease protein
MAVFELMRKDLIAARWFLAILVPFYVLQLATFSSSPPLFYLATIIFTALLGFGPIAVEDHQNMETLWCSLPLERREIVISRYLSVLVGVISGLALSCLTGALVTSTGTAGNDPVLASVPWMQASMFALMSLLAAVFLPCYFRFGAGKGLVVFSALAVGAMVVLSLAVPLALYIAGHANLLADPEVWRETAAKTGAEERTRLAHAVIAVLALLSAVTLLFSAGLSVRFYEKRDF